MNVASLVESQTRVAIQARPDKTIALRPASAADVTAIHDLIVRYREAGHLLPRTRENVASHVAQFVVVTLGGEVVGCAELAPLSRSVAEVRSLVVDEAARGLGGGRLLVGELTRRALLGGHERLSAFTHEPAYFARLGFSIVPHAWVSEKVFADCVGCPLFRRCGQHAMVLELDRAAQRPAAMVRVA